MTAHDLLDVVGLTGAEAGCVARATDVQKWFGDNHVLKGISLEVTTHDRICMIGPSGSGKSTFLRCLAGLELANQGEIEVKGERMGYVKHADAWRPASDRQMSRQRMQVGMVFQSFNLFPHMTVLDNVVVGLRRVKQVKAREAQPLGLALLERVGLAHKSGAYPRQLSGGQQQRVAIVRALAMRPALMLFDEPTSALDPEMIGEVLDVMAELATEGMTMVIVTHEMAFARRAASRVVVMDGGEVIEQGTPAEIFERSQHPRTQSFLSKVL